MSSSENLEKFRDEKDAVRFLMDYLAAREYLSTEKQHFEDFLSIQSRRWRDLADTGNLVSIMRRDDTDAMLRRIRESMTSEERNGQLFVGASIPILLQSLSQEEKAGLHKFSGLVLAALLMHIRPVLERSGNYDQETRNTLDAAFFAADFARFHDVLMLVGEVQVEVDRLGANSEQIRATHVREVNQLASQLKDATQAEKDRAERFAALESALKTKLALGEPVKLWELKAKAHNRSFWVGLALLAILVTVLFLMLFLIVTSLKDQAFELIKSSPIVAAVILASPLIAFFLLLRIVGRYVTASLSLREDARQRRALADMLVRLSAEPALQLDPEARRIAISALFRAAPGQPIDEPATHPLADLISVKPHS